ncbi:heterokaryon incompatibility protein-domain-containing protein [Xylaria arbuscula]|nr:heterokaryon incompatibility protein-domain-containing protein [Xylaria arbuscula]
MNTFRYQPLDLKSSAFRLVRLLKGNGNADIECKLIYTTLDENVIPYEAVSYTWGTSAKPLSITLQGQRFMVTRNLWSLLKSVRQTEADRYIWIDAIAINQDDDLERGHQVQRMQAIYGSAERVIIYLGEATSSTDVLMQSLLILQSQASGCRWAPDDERWQTAWEQAQHKLQSRYNGTTLKDIQQEGLKGLLARPWFRRVWILQEVANARRALVYCGAASIKAQVFAMAPSLLEVELDGHAAAVFKLMPTYSGKIARRVHSGDFCSILIDFRGSEASDARDRIFALVGLCEEQNAKTWIIPNYTQTEVDVIRTTLYYIMGETYKQLLLGIDQLQLEINRLQSKANGLFESTLSQTKLHEQLPITHPKPKIKGPLKSKKNQRSILNWGSHVTQLRSKISQLYLEISHDPQFMSETAQLESELIQLEMGIIQFGQWTNHQDLLDELPRNIDQFLFDLTHSSAGYMEFLLINMFSTWDIETIRSFLSRRENAIQITLRMATAAESYRLNKVERMNLLFRYGRLNGPFQRNDLFQGKRLAAKKNLSWCKKNLNWFKTSISLLKNLEAMVKIYSWSYEYAAEWIWQENLCFFLLSFPKPFLERLTHYLFKWLAAETRERLPKSQRILDGGNHNGCQQDAKKM